MHEPGIRQPLIRHLFVYGTLRPGEVRWHHLSPFVVDEGVPDRVVGHLYDTGLGYPAASFTGTPWPPSPEQGHIVGRTYALLEASLDQALAHLDEVEGAVRGLYHRVGVPTEAGHRAWAYQHGDGLTLTPIPSGDWLHR